MEIKITNQGHVTVARVLDSRLSANVSSEFKFLMGQQIGSGRSNLVLDLSEVTFMDSSGLGAVISLLKLIGTKGDLAIACPQAPIQTLFRLTRMEKVLRLYPTVEEAIQSMAVSSKV